MKKFSTYLFGFSKTDKAINEALKSGGGAVESVNGKTGAVVLTATDIGAYAKPAGGIPAADLSSGVRDSLDLADTAYQKPAGGIPASDLDPNIADLLPHLYRHLIQMDDDDSTTCFVIINSSSTPISSIAEIRALYPVGFRIPVAAYVTAEIAPMMSIKASYLELNGIDSFPHYQVDNGATIVDNVTQLI